MTEIRIQLNDEEYETLQDIKKKDSKTWKELLLSNLENDVLLDEINNCFSMLKSLIPNLQETLEYMRAISIRFYKLSDNDQKIKAKELNAKMSEYIIEIMDVIKNE